MKMMNVSNSELCIAVVTSTRADYGLLSPLIKRLAHHREIELQLFVTGTHLSVEFGFTRNEILKDGYPICEEIDCLISNDTATAIGKSSALALMGLVEAYERNKPDLICLLGDRYEILCAAVAASICRIPIAHLHGGEITEGAYDDSFRHAITKLSHLHFTASEDYRNRVIQLGESPETVYNVGAIGLDNIVHMKLMSSDELEKNLGIRFLGKNILVTLHPETLNPGGSHQLVENLINALERLENVFIIITGSNADSEGRVINERLKEFAGDSDNSLFIESLGQLRYLSMLNKVNAVVGNSSSGIIEVPSFGIPTINIGDRQKGRLRAESVIDTDKDANNLFEAIRTALEKKRRDIINPYGGGNASEAIMNILEKREIGKSLLNKKFYDITE